MLRAAFFAAATASVTGSVWAGVAAAILAAEALALLHGLACITYRGNQVVSGVAINILAAGLTVVLGTAWFARGGQTPPLLDGQRLMPLFLPRAGDNVLVYVALLSVPLTWWVIARTRFGLRLRAVGEMPLAVDAAGLSVAWLRYRAVLLCGLLAGLAGAYLSIGQNATDPGHAVSSHHVPAGRLHRPCDRSQGGRRALRERALKWTNCSIWRAA